MLIPPRNLVPLGDLALAVGNAWRNGDFGLRVAYSRRWSPIQRSRLSGGSLPEEVAKPMYAVGPEVSAQRVGELLRLAVEIGNRRGDDP